MSLRKRWYVLGAIAAVWLASHVQLSFHDHWQWDMYRDPFGSKPAHQLGGWDFSLFAEHLRMFYVGGYAPEYWSYLAEALFFYLTQNALFATLLFYGAKQYLAQYPLVAPSGGDQ